jgi:hypothetical protein
VKTKQAAEYLAISQWKLRKLVQQGLQAGRSESIAEPQEDFFERQHLV